MRLNVPATAWAAALLLAPQPAPAQGNEPDSAADWRTQWAVADELGLDRDTEGYHLPTAIAFVPRPGPGPKDPLYFVTELRGTVKVVTNDRTVHTFAEGFIRSRPLKELPDFAGETGLAGICLAPEQGYVFVTFAYVAHEVTDSAGRPHLSSNRATGLRALGVTFRNSMMRFQAAPGTFSLRPTGKAEYRDVFDGYEAAVSHQVGGCQVSDGLLHVSVADGYQTEQSQDPRSPLGKVLRLTLDGRAAPGNPFSAVRDTRSRREYVWASGFRNPFGLKAVGNRLFVADNGMRIDRFLQVRRGENYLWNGDDWSIGARADLTFYPDIGPAQIDYYPGGTVLPPRYAPGFLVAASNPDRPGVLGFGYSVADGVGTGIPAYLVRYRGKGHQIVTGVAVGPDGVYFVPTLPDAGGDPAVYRLSYRPERPHPLLLASSVDPTNFMEERGCFGCHQLAGAGGTMGPALDAGALLSRVRTRLGSPEYAARVRQLDSLDQEPYRRFRAARADVLGRSGPDQVRTWVMYRLLEPKFDDPLAQMPNLGLTRSEATTLADHLLREENAGVSWSEALVRRIPPALRPWPIMYRHLLLAFMIGAVAGGVLLAILTMLRHRMQRRRA